MSAPVLRITPLARERESAAWRRRCRLERVDDGAVTSESVLWFTVQGVDEIPPDDDCDSYLLALLLDAMLERRQIQIAGSVSATLLSNLVEWQSAWVRWLPDTYAPVEIVADSICRGGRPAARAVCAYSGGVDSMFTVWRHSQGLSGHRSQDMAAAALVHGFDIPLAEAEAFARVAAQARDTLASVSLPLWTVATNFREVALANWEHVHAAALVAALANFRPAVGVCLVGSTEPYDRLYFPWGSTPATDYLLSSDTLTVMHDGASHGRTEKVAAIAAWPAGVDSLRVCWQGPAKDRNCGHCEKCLRTMLNFAACGREVPGCFSPDPRWFERIKVIHLRSRGARLQWEQLLAYARLHGVSGPWVPYAEAALREGERMSRRSHVKRRIRNVISRLGLQALARRLR